MKEKLLQKRNQKGFTLMEMLIVVAIIAILVAIAIPVFNAQLEKAREATDAANVRAAKAVAVATYLTDGEVDGSAIVNGTTYYFDAAEGDLDASTPTPGYGKAAGNNNKVIEVVFGADGVVSCEFPAT